MTSVARPLTDLSDAAAHGLDGRRDRPSDESGIGGDSALRATMADRCALSLKDLSQGEWRAESRRRNGKSKRERPRGAAIAEIALALAVGLVAARLVFLVAAPLPTPDRLPTIAAAEADPAAMALRNVALNPFRVAANVAAPSPDAAVAIEGEALEETSLDLILHGVRMDGEATTAIIQASGGEQAIFSLGGEVAPNVVFESARREQVTLNRNGVRETLTMVNRELRDAPESPPAARSATRRSGATARSVGPTLDWSDVAKVDTRIEAGQLRIVLNPGARRDAFEAAGLRPGDTLLFVNGQPLGRDPASIAKRIESLAGATSVDMIVERDGVRVPLTVSLKGGDGERNE
ncbi:MAG: type II secretion system protein N [Pseudomonadota bacterium]